MAQSSPCDGKSSEHRCERPPKLNRPLLPIVTNLLNHPFILTADIADPAAPSARKEKSRDSTNRQQRKDDNKWIPKNADVRLPHPTL